MRFWSLGIIFATLCLAAGPIVIGGDVPANRFKSEPGETRFDARRAAFPEPAQRHRALLFESERFDADDVEAYPIIPVENIFTLDGTSERNDLEPTLSERLARLEEKVNGCPPPDCPPIAGTDYPTVRITGFLQLDSAVISQSPLNIATVGDAQNGAGFRRARLAVFGKAAEYTGYQLEVDFATAGRPSFFDNYVEQGNLPFFGTVRAGQYLQPFSVDAMSGFRNLPFLERSLPFLAFVPFRRVGIMAYNSTDDEMTHWAYSVFRTGGFYNFPLGDDRFAVDIGNVGGYSFSGRITHLLQYEDGDERLWHVGFAYDYSRLGANNAVGSGRPGNAGSPEPFYCSQVLPEFGPLGYPENPTSFGNASNFTPPIFIDSGRYQAKDFNLWGLETVFQSGPFSFQSEYMANLVNTNAGSVLYHGAYAEVLYRLTGEHRPYDKRLAALKNVIPFQEFYSFRGENAGVLGWGAWEVAARLSYVEMRNPSSFDGHYYDNITNTFTTTAKAGNGTLTDTTLGCTWFMTSHSKWQFNWIHAFLNNSAKGFSQADLFVMRIQVDF